MVNNIRLYWAGSIIPELGRLKNVPVTWIRLTDVNRFGDKEYKDLIEGFDEIDVNMRIYPISVIEELFIEDEIEILRNFLKNYYGTDMDWVKEYELPIPPNTAGLTCCALGRSGPDIVVLDIPKEANLPFIFGGFFDIRNLDFDAHDNSANCGFEVDIPF